MQVYMPASSTFDMIDRNHDGVITRSEFTHAAMMPPMTCAGSALGGLQRVVYSAPQQPTIYEQAAAPVMFSGQPQLTYSASQPAQVVYEQAGLASGVVTYAAAPTSQVTYQQAPAVSYVAPAASQVVGEQYVHASAQVTDEETSPVVTEVAPAAQVTCEQSAPAVTYAAAPAPPPVPTLISYPANTASQPTAQVTYMSSAVTATEQLGTEQSFPVAGSASIVAARPSVIESAVVAGATPTMLTYMHPMVQPQAVYYQVGGVQAAAVQPQVTYGTTAPGMQTVQMIAVPAGAAMQQFVAVPQQTEAVAVPVMEQPAVVNGKKTKKKRQLTYKNKSKGCC